jgi:hypothetical protein
MSSPNSDSVQNKTKHHDSSFYFYFPSNVCDVANALFKIELKEQKSYALMSEYVANNIFFLFYFWWDTLRTTFPSIDQHRSKVAILENITCPANCLFSAIEKKGPRWLTCMLGTNSSKEMQTAFISNVGDKYAILCANAIKHNLPVSFEQFIGIFTKVVMALSCSFPQPVLFCFSVSLRNLLSFIKVRNQMIAKQKQKDQPTFPHLLYYLKAWLEVNTFEMFSDTVADIIKPLLEKEMRYDQAKKTMRFQIADCLLSLYKQCFPNEISEKPIDMKMQILNSPNRKILDEYHDSALLDATRHLFCASNQCIFQPNEEEEEDERSDKKIETHIVSIICNRNKCHTALYHANCFKKLPVASTKLNCLEKSCGGTFRVIHLHRLANPLAVERSYVNPLLLTPPPIDFKFNFLDVCISLFRSTATSCSGISEISVPSEVLGRLRDAFQLSAEIRKENPHLNTSELMSSILNLKEMGLECQVQIEDLATGFSEMAQISSPSSKSNNNAITTTHEQSPKKPLVFDVEKKNVKSNYDIKPTTKKVEKKKGVEVVIKPAKKHCYKSKSKESQNVAISKPKYYSQFDAVRLEAYEALFVLKDKSSNNKKVAQSFEIEVIVSSNVYDVFSHEVNVQMPFLEHFSVRNTKALSMTCNQRNETFLILLRGDSVCVKRASQLLHECNMVAESAGGFVEEDNDDFDFKYHEESVQADIMELALWWGVAISDFPPIFCSGCGEPHYNRLPPFFKLLGTEKCRLLHIPNDKAAVYLLWTHFESIETAFSVSVKFTQEHREVMNSVTRVLRIQGQTVASVKKATNFIQSVLVLLENESDLYEDMLDLLSEIDDKAESIVAAKQMAIQSEKQKRDELVSLEEEPAAITTMPKKEKKLTKSKLKKEEKEEVVQEQNNKKNETQILNNNARAVQNQYEEESEEEEKIVVMPKFTGFIPKRLRVTQVIKSCFSSPKIAHYVIGKLGNVVRRLEHEYQIFLQMDPDRYSGGSIIRITGLKESVAAAGGRIQKLVDLMENNEMRLTEKELEHFRDTGLMPIRCITKPVQKEQAKEPVESLNLLSTVAFPSLPSSSATIINDRAMDHIHSREISFQNVWLESQDSEDAKAIIEEESEPIQRQTDNTTNVLPEQENSFWIEFNKQFKKASFVSSLVRFDPSFPD